jgi:hypothetical protein
MALRSIKADDQLGMDERVIQDPDIEQALEARQRAKDERAEKNLAVKNATEKVKSLISRLEMPDPSDEDKPSVVRVGRFRITKRFVKGKTVSFATEDRVQLTFGLADEQGEERQSRATTTPSRRAGRDRAARLAKTSGFATPRAVADDDLPAMRPRVRRRLPHRALLLAGVSHAGCARDGSLDVEAQPGRSVATRRAAPRWTPAETEDRPRVDVARGRRNPDATG